VLPSRYAGKTFILVEKVRVQVKPACLMAVRDTDEAGRVAAESSL